MPISAPMGLANGGNTKCLRDWNEAHTPSSLLWAKFSAAGLSLPGVKHSTWSGWVRPNRVSWQHFQVCKGAEVVVALITAAMFKPIWNAVFSWLQDIQWTDYLHSFYIISFSRKADIAAFNYKSLVETWFGLDDKQGDNEMLSLFVGKSCIISIRTPMKC